MTLKSAAALLLLFVSALTASAQTRSKMTIGGSINPFYTGSINTSSSSDPMNAAGTSYKTYNDSIKSKEQLRLSFGVTAWYNYLINTDWTLQVGLGYADVGFQRVQNNIKYNERTYPGMGSGPSAGRVTDLSNNEKNIEYNYRYQYIQLPVLFNYNVRMRRDMFFSMAFTGGASVNVLVDHRITANLVNFTIDGESSFAFDSTGYSGSRFGLNLLLGVRGDYRLDKQFSVMLQPFFCISPLSVSSSPISAFPYWFGAQVGLLYHLKKE